ncbi:MAG: HAD family hydrolase [Hyphomicrobium sp.]
MKPGCGRKPAPDSYLSAAAQLQVKPEQCVVVEDSVIGATAGKAAGCFVIGVATGAASFEELSASHQVDAAIASLAPSVVSLTEGNVQNKRLQTQNDFVSHMIEHIAWRTSSSVELQWTSDDWGLLGERVGQSLRERLDTSAPVAALGMIDDGSAEVLIDWSLEPGFDLQAVPHIDRDLILSTRVEQLAEPTPLVRRGWRTEWRGASARA